MKQIRLLPIVIFASVALLMFKGIGLVTNGGYVLTGTAMSQAAEASPSEPSVENAAPRTEPTMSDTSPTMADSAPTLVTKAPDAKAAEGGAAASADGHASTPAAPAPAADTAHADPVAAGGTTTVASVTGASNAACAPAAALIAGAPKPAKEDGAVTGGSAIPTGCLPADAEATEIGPTGAEVPLAGADGTPQTDQTILQRLGERRAELDKREAVLVTREAIVQAAERQMDDRAAALKALQAQITALSDQKNAMQDAQFASVVNMYENMKPQEAASIFNGLDMSVLMRIAKAMSPRKMSPVLAQMASARAQELTTRLAAEDADIVATSQPATTDPNALPQIVGQ